MANSDLLNLSYHSTGKFATEPTSSAINMRTRITQRGRDARGSGCTPYGVCPLPTAPQPRWAALPRLQFGGAAFFRSAFGTFCMCEARGVSPLLACSTCRRNARCPLVKTTNLLFPWSDRFFFDSSSTKYYPFFFTDTGRTSGRPAGSFAFVCISLTCSDRHDRGT